MAAQLAPRGLQLTRPRRTTWRSAIEPDGHARLESSRSTLWVEAQAQRVAIVIADCALGLPGREGAKRPQLGNDGRGCRARARVRDLDRGTDREAGEEIFADVNDSHCCPVAAIASTG